MTVWTLLPPIIVAAYLIGSIPFALLIAAAHGKDLRAIGSGNIGATNLARACGRKWAYVCFVLDAAKGLLPVLAALTLSNRLLPATQRPTPLFLTLWLAVGVAAVLGHVFPLYARFKGGKGVAVSFGVALGIWPYYTVCALLALVVWVIVVLAWRYVSLASICAAVAFPVFLAGAMLLAPTWPLAELWPLLVAAIAIPLGVIARHRANIQRLLAGTERKVLTGKPRA